MRRQRNLNGRGSEAWGAVERELERSRRSGRGFVLLTMPCSSNGHRRAGEPSAERLSEHLRALDEAWYDEGLFYVLLPEADRASAGTVVERILVEAPELLASGEARVAAFPDDGLTAGALRETLRREAAAARNGARGIALDIPAVLAAAARVAQRGHSGNGNGNGQVAPALQETVRESQPAARPVQ
ncbi:MAG TPA: hypothetical protein VFV62_05345 [Gaiellaceae bacterium]|nr:hypothetical protein [Gaiellaceae bacterium]